MRRGRSCLLRNLAEKAFIALNGWAIIILTHYQEHRELTSTDMVHGLQFPSTTKLCTPVHKSSAEEGVQIYSNAKAARALMQKLSVTDLISLEVFPLSITAFQEARRPLFMHAYVQPCACTLRPVCIISCTRHYTNHKG